jgi:ribosomal protein S18 acetylase RimI-like enzyme
MTDGVSISKLDADGAREKCESLAEILWDCVEGGASVSFMWPFDVSQSLSYWSGVVAALSENRLRLYAASYNGRLGGTVQLWLDGPCNQQHRADIRKLLVHRTFRRRGLARDLMRHAEAEARAMGRTLLTLDTVTGAPAERLYESLAWQKAGVIPRYAKWPDGRFCDATVLFKDIS